jgi:Uma2 family endonuclease
MATSPLPFFSFEEYLALEQGAGHKSEYFDGEIVAMSGGTRGHSLIIVNIARHLGNLLAGSDRELHSGELLFRTANARMGAYPDIMVLCGRPQFEGENDLVALNPKVLFEVLSPSTEAYDRGTKAREYWRCPSVQQYLLISQDQPQVEVQSRASQSKVSVEWFSGLDAVCPIESLGVQLPLGSIYERLSF